MRALIVSIALLASLAACATPETPEERDAYDNLWCADQGIYQGDALYAECRRRATTMRGHQYTMGGSTGGYTPSPMPPAQDKRACTGGFFQCNDYYK